MSIAPATIPLCLLAPNRSTFPVNACSYRTSIVVAEGTQESRRAQTGKPFRTVTYKAATLDRTQIGGLVSQTRKGSEGRYYYPLWSDELAVPVIPPFVSNIFVPCDALNCRYFVGYKAILMAWDIDKRAYGIFVGNILAVSSTGITLEGSPSFDPANVRDLTVAPAIEVDVAFDFEASALTDRVITPSLILRERVGATALPPLVTPGTLPAGEPTYQGLPVFAVPVNWSEPVIGQSRANLSTEVGLDVITEVYGPRSMTRVSAPFQFQARADGFRLLRFFDSRGGKAFPFWGYTGTSDFTIISKTSGTVWVIRGDLNATEMLKQKFVAFLGLDQGVQFRRVVSAVNVGANVSITLDASVAYTEPEVDRLSLGMLARFDVDEIRETWLNDRAMTTDLTWVEIPSNSCGTGEVGDTCDSETDIPCVPDEGTDVAPQDPWIPNDNPCEGSLAPSPFTVPMYCYPCDALNSQREMIRAADYSMPSFISIKINDGFEPDLGHPSGHVVSGELLQALINDNNWHLLEFVGVTASTASRHWHHMRLNDEATANWSMSSGGETVTKYLYQKTIPYVAFKDLPAQANCVLDLRFLVEWTTGPSGARGVLIHWAAFTNEVYPSFTDGNNYIPAGAPGLVSFSRNDPACWGKVAYPAVATSEKYLHPQLVLFGNVATTFQAPCGGLKVPLWEDENAFCYKRGNGSPWCSPSVSPVARARNCVFGHDISTFNMRACTLGGDVPFSDFFEWITLENGRKQGKTLLRPLMPGWDEEEGELVLGQGANVEVMVCNPPQEENRVDVCRGHPDEPFETIGGTHKCFNNKSVESGGVCEQIGPFSTGVIQEACVTQTINLDKDCSPLRGSCRSSFITTSLTAPLKDYSYYANGNQLLRYMEFEFRTKDPEFVPIPEYSYEYPLTTGLSQVRGTWTLGPDVVVASVVSVSGGRPTALLQYNPGSIYQEIKIVAAFQTGTGIIPIGIGRGIYSGGHWSGIAGFVLPGEGKVQIRKYTSDSFVVLAEKKGLNLSGTFRATLVISKAQIKFYWDENLDHFVFAEDCTYTDGYPFCMTEGAAAGAFFVRGFKVTDSHQGYLFSSLIVSVDDVSGGISEGMTHGWGKCNTSTNTGCLDLDVCPCSTSSSAKQGIYSASSLDELSTILGGANPDEAYCSGEPLSPPLPNCESCPPPFVALAFTLPGACVDSSVPKSSMGKFVDGFQRWSSVRGVAP